VFEVGHNQLSMQDATVGTRIRAHASHALWSHFFEICPQLSVFAEQLFGMITLQPCFQLLKMLWIFTHSCQGNLVSTPVAFNFMTVHFFWPCPAFWTAQNN